VRSRFDTEVMVYLKYSYGVIRTAYQKWGDLWRWLKIGQRVPHDRIGVAVISNSNRG